MKTILAPVDLSPATSAVCAAACELAKLVSGRVMLLHIVAPPPPMLNEYYAFDTGHLAQAMAILEDNGARKLHALAKRYSARGVTVRAVQETGAPVAAILARAAASKASYIVMGSHGHGAMFDLLAGSTTQGVLRKVNCPVLVVPVAKR